MEFFLLTPLGSVNIPCFGQRGDSVLVCGGPGSFLLHPGVSLCIVSGLWGWLGLFAQAQLVRGLFFVLFVAPNVPGTS